LLLDGVNEVNYSATKIRNTHAIHNNTNTIDFLANVAIKAAVIKEQLVTQTRSTTRLNRNTQV
jgi:hypothetical protein